MIGSLLISYATRHSPARGMGCSLRTLISCCRVCGFTFMFPKSPVVVGCYRTRIKIPPPVPKTSRRHDSPTEKASLRAYRVTWLLSTIQDTIQCDFKTVSNTGHTPTRWFYSTFHTLNVWKAKFRLSSPHTNFLSRFFSMTYFLPLAVNT